MQLIPIGEAKPGMKLAQPIYRASDGRILLQSNIELTVSLIERLKILNYSNIYVQDDAAESESTPGYEPVKEATKLRATIFLKSIIRQVKGDEPIDVEKLKSVIREAIDQILNDTCVVYNLIKLRSFDQYTFSHSINVSVLSLLIGSSMGFDRNELEIIGTGAMLHDIGKATVKEKILKKPSKLDSWEYELIKRHTNEGFDILKTKSNISFISAHVAYQHHEREDGSGYPRGLTGKNIHRYAKIAAVADVFDAMTTPRPYQKEVPPYLAIKEIADNKAIKYDPYVVQHFMKVVAPYPIGSILLLSNGQNVTVTHVGRERCLVKVNSGVHEGKTYNLYKQPDLKVVAQLS